MQQPSTQHRPGTAIALKLLAVFLFIVMAAMIKAATHDVPPGQAVFFRSLFAMPIIVGWIWQKGDLREALVPNNLMGHVWRGVFGTSAMALTFAGIGAFATARGDGHWLCHTDIHRHTCCPYAWRKGTDFSDQRCWAGIDRRDDRHVAETEP